MKYAQPRQVKSYMTSEGRVPFEEWMEELKDWKGKAAVKNRIRRLEQGNPGFNRWIGEGVLELKIDVGPGYRVYYGEDGPTIVLLLCGGDKNTQEKDIKKAQEYWADYRRT